MEILASVPKKLRNHLKSEDYASPHHLIEVYRKKYRNSLTYLRIPLHTPYRNDIKQSLKDIHREVLIVNGRVYNGFKSEKSFEYESIEQYLERSSDARMTGKQFDCEENLIEDHITAFEAIASLLLLAIGKFHHDDVAFADWNIDFTPFFKNLLMNRVDDPPSIGSNDNTKTIKLTEDVQIELFEESDQHIEVEIPKTDLEVRLTHNDDAEHNSKVLTPVSSLSSLSSCVEEGGGSVATLMLYNDCEGSNVFGVGWHRHLFELLLNYVLVTSSRSFVSGDAYVILNDLYGDENLILCPTMVKSQSHEDNYTKVSITSKGVKIVVIDSFTLYQQGCMVQENPSKSTNRDIELSPLMSFECTTTTIIDFHSTVKAARENYGYIDTQSVKPKEISMLNDVRDNTQHHAHTSSLKSDNYHLLMKLFDNLRDYPESICNRSITIVPKLPVK
jgi:hypothetical protein